MNDLVIFYLLTTATQVFPLVFITLCLTYGTPLPFLPRRLSDQVPLNRRLQNMGVTRVDQFFEVFDSDFRKYLAKWGLIGCVVQVITVALITLAMIFDVPLPYVADLNDRLPEGIIYELLTFLVITSIIQLIPIIFLVMALLFDIPLPFMPTPPENRAPLSNEIIRWERQTSDFASIRFTRFENLEKTFVYATCHDDRLGAFFKLVFCQGKERGARTECYVYDDNNVVLDRIIPAPLSVSELEQIFDLGNE